MAERGDWDWRCGKCGTLLGVERRGRLHLKYKTAQYVVTGAVTAICRRCLEVNQTVCPRDSGSSGACARAA